MCFRPFKGFFRLEIERLLHESLAENDRLRDFEKKASAMIQVAESKHKSAEAGLMTAECQVVELSEKYDREIEHSSKLWGDISALKAEVHEAQVAAHKAEDSAQAYYDQGFDEAANSLKSQLAEKCNKYFIQGWRADLDRARVDDASELYDLGPKR
jgi:chromosome segregation ATPase